jgi:hypothetical protein
MGFEESALFEIPKPHKIYSGGSRNSGVKSGDVNER